MMSSRTDDATDNLVHTLTCTACGHRAPADDRFCGQCGAALPGRSNGALSHAENTRRRIGGTTWTPVSPVEQSITQLSGAPVTVSASTTTSTRKRRRRRTRWYRRKLVVLPLVLLVLMTGVAGAAVYRAQTTLNTLHEISELPPQVTDSTQTDDGLPTGLVFDTEPARQALVTAGILPADGTAKDDGVFGKFKDATGDVGDLASGAAVAAGVKDPSKDAITILVMGVDAREGAPIDIGVRPDAIMVLYLNPATGACRGLAIPRDSKVNLPGYGETKVNHALMLGGVQYQQLVLEQFLQLDIDHYALIDFAGFQALVDAVGGVTVNVPSELKNGETVLFDAGPQTFDGEEALRYARYRGEADYDIGRIRRQQQIMRGLIQVSGGRNIASDINEILPAFSNHVRTDLDSTELVTLADQYRSQCSDESFELDTIGGELVPLSDTLDPVLQKPQTYLITDSAVVSAKVANLTRP